MPHDGLGAGAPNPRKLKPLSTRIAPAMWNVIGIRIHHNRAVLLSTGTSVYRDGIGWEKDSDGEYVFEYTGEGLDGNQQMDGGNYFLKNSDGGLFLFVKRSPNDYVFFGEVKVKRIEEAIEPDRKGIARKVFKFILRRVAVE